MNTRTARLVLAVSVCALTLPTVAAAGALDDLLALALERDPSLAAASARADAAQAGVGLARGALLPRVGATAGYTRNAYAAEVELPGADPVVITPLDQLEATVRLDVPLVDAAGWASLAAARSCGESGEAIARADAERALLDVVRAAWELRAAERVRESAVAAAEAHARALERATARAEAGLGPSLDALRARGDSARAEGDSALADADLEAARRALAARTGLSALPGPLEPRLAPAGELDASGLPSVQAARADLACRSADATAARLGLAPTLAGFALGRASNATGFTGKAATWAAGATLSWAPVDGGRRVARAQEADARRRAAAAELARLEQQADDDLADARARLRAAERVLSAARARAEAADAASADAQARFEAGTGLAVEVSLAVDEARAAAAALARAEATHAVAIESLRVAAGLPMVAGDAR